MTKLKNIDKILTCYTHGLYSKYCEYSQYLIDKNSKISYHTDNKFWIEKNLPFISEKEKNDTLEIINEINMQEISDTTLIRLEKFNNLDIFDYNIGDCFNFGIKSCSKNLNFANDIWRGKIDGIYIYDNAKYIEYRIIGNKKHLDISRYSEYNQDESLVFGKFKIIKKEYVCGKPAESAVYGNIYEYAEFHNVEIIKFTSKSGKKMIKTADGRFIMDIEKDLEVEKIIKEEVEKEDFFDRIIITIEQVF